MLCVYALTGAGTLGGAPRGLAGERLRLVRSGPVAAVAGELPRTPRPTLANLRRYDAVNRALHARRAALLPARFGTCFGSIDELLAALTIRRRQIQAALAAVRHRTQMIVRVPSAGRRDRPGDGAGRRASPRPHTSWPHGRGRGLRYLRARAALAAAGQHAPELEPIRSAVARWVRAERVETRAGVATVYHLVPRSAAAAYRRLIERTAARAALRVVVSGPWPPYAFASSDVRPTG